MAMTSTAIAVDALLRVIRGTTLADWLTAQRDQGYSFERIARELYETTDGDIDVASRTIRNWINDLEAVA